MILKSPSIGDWLSQFDEQDHATAVSLLMHLNFVPRDVFAAWLQHNLRSLEDGLEYALYAVRKLEDEQKPFWNKNGEVVHRPSTSQGSEDFVYSQIAGMKRQNRRFCDHPSLSELRDKRIKNIILIDDSVGSGRRVVAFIRAMMANKTFLSWWSYGYIKITILAYARTLQGERRIHQDTPGSDSSKRVFRKSSKIAFISSVRYNARTMACRWGSQHDRILRLCDSVEAISSKWRRGFGGVMGNIIFYHSVPNNIPGILFCRDNGWHPLLSGRTLPDWLTSMLDNPSSSYASEERGASSNAIEVRLSGETMDLLLLIKRGVRRLTTLALRMDRDPEHIRILTGELIEWGLISEKYRLTTAGINAVQKQIGDIRMRHSLFSGELYIPQSWCAD